MFSNNSTNFNATNTTLPTSSSSDFTQVFFPVILKLLPSKLYTGSVRNITHITTLIKGQELGLKGTLSLYQFNLTLLLQKPWSMSCDLLECSGSTFSACIAVALPTEMIPKGL